MKSQMGNTDVKFIGKIRSQLKSLEMCPRQGSEGAPSAIIEIDAAYGKGLNGVCVGRKLLILTWFHRADRTVLEVHPKRDTEKPLTGVFLTRSPDRPNPVGVHSVRVEEVCGNDPLILKVFPLEALDGTPIIDIKIALG